ncbi:DUF4126 domain-containing protein [Agromyces sp. MMS24-K17]|uniref:DUF4126 domain-containing protein n=1 Tax=Agromyces sp. MMS24-K17 TaxID=3372850 RepID=UPI003754E014
MRWIASPGSFELPAPWAWLSNEWVLLVMVVLLVVEMAADKVPGFDSVNDVVQTIVRPTAGGLAFGSGTAATTVAVTDPAAFVESGQWVPIAIGAAIALAVHLAKAVARPIINGMTAGIGAPIASGIEDVASTALAFAAILVPVLVVLGVVLAVVLAVVLLRRLARRRAERARAAGLDVGSDGPPSVAPPA